VRSTAGTSTPLDPRAANIASLENLDFAGRQALLRAVIEKVTVTGCRVEIHLKIPLTGHDDNPENPDTPPPPRPSSDNDLRSLDRHRHRQLAVPPRPRTPHRQEGSLTPHPGRRARDHRHYAAALRATAP
jgi:hypothetical protein